MPSPLRPLLALAAFPAGWAVREQGSAGVGGIVVLVLIAAAAAGLPRGAAARVVLLGIACFVRSPPDRGRDRYLRRHRARRAGVRGDSVRRVANVPFDVSASRRLLRVIAAGVVTLACGWLTACGGSSPATPRLSVALDFTPNAVHAPIYTAVRQGLDRDRGVRLRIVAPGSSPDSLKSVLTGSADVGVLDIHDLGLALARGRDLVAVGALVERPLAAIITRASIRRPRDLEGRRVGVSGLPSDPAVLRAVLSDDGGSLARVKQVTIGFAAVQSLASGRIDGVPAFWNAEGVALRRRHVAIHEFRVDDFGAPRYPEVVLVVKRSTLRARGDAVRDAVAAIAAGMRAVRADPDTAAAEIAKASGSSVASARAQIDAVTPIYGTVLHRSVLDAWNGWDVRFGILPRRVDVARAFLVG